MSQINFANTQFAKFVNYANSLPNASHSKAIVAAATCWRRRSNERRHKRKGVKRVGSRCRE